MKICLTLVLIITFYNFGLSQNTSNPFFPLEIGNRWDYFIEIRGPGGLIKYDTLSIEIIDKQVLPNGLEYYMFSYFPFWYPGYNFAREENDEIYFYIEQDSTDCFAFKFDLPVGSIYTNCFNGQLPIDWIDTSFYWGIFDIQQTQFLYMFSEHFGIYNYIEPGVSTWSYYLRGCIISGTTYGNLLVPVDEEDNIPSTFKLLQNYPNPFNPNTKIKYQIPEFSFVTIKVYDVLGNEITTLVNEEKPASNYEVELDGANLTSGIYFYQLRAEDFIQTKKMVLIK